MWSDGCCSCRSLVAPVVEERWGEVEEAEGEEEEGEMIELKGPLRTDSHRMAAVLQQGNN